MSNDGSDSSDERRAPSFEEKESVDGSVDEEFVNDLESREASSTSAMGNRSNQFKDVIKLPKEAIDQGEEYEDVKSDDSFPVFAAQAESYETPDQLLQLEEFQSPPSPYRIQEEEKTEHADPEPLSTEVANDEPEPAQREEFPQDEAGGETQNNEKNEKMDTNGTTVDATAKSSQASIACQSQKNVCCNFDVSCCGCNFDWSCSLRGSKGDERKYNKWKLPVLAVALAVIVGAAVSGGIAAANRAKGGGSASNTVGNAGAVEQYTFMPSVGPTSFPSSAPTSPPVFPENLWSAVDGDGIEFFESQMYGWSVAMSASGNTVAATPFYSFADIDPSNGGTLLEILEKSGGGWQSVLADSVRGDPNVAKDEVGSLVDVSDDGRIVAVRSPFAGESELAPETGGQVRIFDLSPQTDNEPSEDAGSWVEMGLPIRAVGNELIKSISLSGGGQSIAVEVVNHVERRSYLRPFRFDGRNWIQTANMPMGVPSSTDETQLVSLSQDGIIVAAVVRDDDDCAMVRVFKYSSGDWNQVSRIDVGDHSCRAHISMAMSADAEWIAIGIVSFFDRFLGLVDVYSWAQRPQMWEKVGAGEVSAGGTTIWGGNEGDRLGWSIAISPNGRRVVAGAPRHASSNGPNSGQVRVFEWPGWGCCWEQVGQTIVGDTSGGLLGYAVAMSSTGNHIVLGAPHSDSGDSGGKVRVYQFGAGDPPD